MPQTRVSGSPPATLPPPPAPVSAVPAPAPRQQTARNRARLPPADASARTAAAPQHLPSDVESVGLPRESPAKATALALAGLSRGGAKPGRRRASRAVIEAGRRV